MPKISRLEIKNCLGISELEIQAGKVNLIKGGNERGKTSVLEVIEKGLQNTQRRTKFVKDGAKEATLYIEMDDSTAIDRRIKPDGKTNSKVTQHGASIPKPETYLKTIIGEGFGFNPVDFMGKKDKEQTDILLSLIPMRVTEDSLMEWFGEVPPVNLNQHAIDVLAYLAEKYFYDKRALANAAVKECANEIKALFEQLPDNYDGDQWREVNIGELWGKVTDAQKVNQFREQAQEAIDGQETKTQAIDNKFDLQIKEQHDLFEFKADRARKNVEEDKQLIVDEIMSIEDEITEMEEKIKLLQEGIQAAKNRIILKENDLKNIDEGIVAVKIEGLEKERDAAIKAIEERRDEEKQAVQTRANNAAIYLEKNPVIDIEPLEQAAKQAETMKGYINLYDNMRAHQEALKDKQATATQLNDCVELARVKPAELLQQIELPIKGLGINEQMQITIDDLPITNLSTSRQIKLALDIARATAGPLKLICFDRFESLDDDQREMFLN
ncbi:MAG: hypothetical protein WC248_08150, partial [Candidatus Methanomethylophilaceae archaeon]